MRACALALALSTVALIARPAMATERIHYIAADDVIWNYAPSGFDLVSGRTLQLRGPAQLGWSYHKLIYREYADASFTRLAAVDPAERYRGLVGPAVHAGVGDTVIVVFKNRTKLAVDIAPTGVVSNPLPSAVPPGETRTYRWPITAALGPAAGGESSTLWVYSSDVKQGVVDSGALIGPLIVTRRGLSRPDGSPLDVDRELVMLFSSQLEDQSPLVEENLHDRRVNPRGIAPKAATFFTDNAFPSINGYVYGNMPMPVIRLGQHVRWYLLTTTNGFDGHTPTWDGQTVVVNGNRSDSIGQVFNQTVADMTPDDPGIWLLTCSLDIHLKLGMEARYEVAP